ncbi:MAG: AEC family transporter, partial [Pseudomonadota bacterium]
LSAMLFRFSANLSLAEVWDWRLVAAYLWATTFVYGIATIVGLVRGQSMEVTAFEAQCAVIGNTGFLGVPMLTLLLGPEAIGPVVLALAIDLIVFSSLIVIVVTISREGRMQFGVLKTVGLGLLKNPMIVAMSAGFVWSSVGLPLPTALDDFLVLLGAAATPGALFAIGASLAGKSAERIEVAGWLTFAKLVLHPLAVAGACIYVFKVAPFASAVLIATASLPVAGNIYILAQHYGVAPTRVSAAILVSTAVSIVTVSLVIAWVSAGLL